MPILGVSLEPSNSLACKPARLLTYTTSHCGQQSDSYFDACSTALLLLQLCPAPGFKAIRETSHLTSTTGLAAAGQSCSQRVCILLCICCYA